MEKTTITKEKVGTNTFYQVTIRSSDGTVTHSAAFAKIAAAKKYAKDHG